MCISKALYPIHDGRHPVVYSGLTKRAVCLNPSVVIYKNVLIQQICYEKYCIRWSTSHAYIDPTIAIIFH